VRQCCSTVGCPRGSLASCYFQFLPLVLCVLCMRQIKLATRHLVLAHKDFINNIVGNAWPWIGARTDLTQQQPTCLTIDSTCREVPTCRRLFFRAMLWLLSQDVCLSVCYTSVLCQTASHIVVFCLAFVYRFSRTKRVIKYQRATLSGALNTQEVENITDFPPIRRCISETVQDKSTVTLKCG